MLRRELRQEGEGGELCLQRLLLLRLELVLASSAW